MADVLEVTRDDLTSEHVARRVEDWIARIGDLYDSIIGWLPAGWRADAARSRPMDETMMREHGIGAVELPFLDLVSAAGRRASIEPRYLWILGPNGRLDLTTESSHHLIVDLGDAFSPAEWQIASLDDREHLVALTRETFLSALAA